MTCHDPIRFSSVNIGVLVSHRLSKFAFEYNEAQALVIMACSVAKFKKCCKWVGRGLFFAALAIQCGFLVAYPAKYKDNSHWYAMSASYGPAAILWFCLIVFGRMELFPSFFVWAMYIYCALLPNVIVIFGFVVESLESVSKEELLDPNVLKIMLCLTPLLLLLLVNTADNSHSSGELRELVSMLSVQMAIDLLDTVEMLDIALEDKEHKYNISKAGYGIDIVEMLNITLEDKENKYNISKGYEIATLVVACFSFFLSPWQMAEIKFFLGEPDGRRHRTTLARIVVEMIGVNLAFLIIRVLIFSEYGKDESIFIAKNAIAIILSCLEIGHRVHSHR